jgi:hypothetical protein
MVDLVIPAAGQLWPLRSKMRNMQIILEGLG